MRQILFKNFSYVEISTRTENKYIKQVKAGETYVPVDDAFDDTIFPDEDVVKRGTWWNSYRWKCVAKEELWYCGGDHWYRTIEEVAKDWDNSVMYDSSVGKWYNRPWLEVHLLGGEKYKTYFDTDEELEEYVNEFFDQEHHQIGID